MSTHDTPTDRGNRSESTRRLSVKQVVGIVVLVLVAVFCAQNTGDTTIQFFGGETQSPLWVWLLGVLVVGVLVGFVLGYRKKG